MKKIISCLVALLMCCSIGGITTLAAVIPDGSIASPCYTYTDRLTTSFGVYDGEASCTTTIYGIPGTTTKIVVTQILEKKNGKSWDEVKKWSGITYNNWYCNCTNSYTVTESGTYRLRTEAKVYCGSKSEDVDITSTEQTVTI